MWEELRVGKGGGLWWGKVRVKTGKKGRVKGG